MKIGVNNWAHDLGEHNALRNFLRGHILGRVSWANDVGLRDIRVHLHVEWPPTLAHAQCVVVTSGRIIVDSHA